MGNNEILKKKRESWIKDSDFNLDFRSKIVELINDFSNNIAKIEIQKNRFKINNDGDMDQQIKEMITLHFNKTNYLVVRLNNFFDLMFKSISEKQKETSDPKMVDSKLRITNFLVVLFKQKFDILILKLNKLQITVSFEYQKKIERTLKIYKADLTEKEIKQLSSDPNKMNDFIQQHMMMSGEFENAVREIDEKLSEIKELEKNMNRLLELIRNLHKTINQQNVVVDSILQTVNNIRDHSEKSHSNMDKGWEYQVDTKQVN